MSGDQTAGLAVATIFGVIGAAFLAALAIYVFVCWVLSGCFKRIPPPHRKLEPGLVWLLLIPCFFLVWNFFVFPRLAQSYRSYFASVGRTDVGDCGEGIAWAFAICAAVSCLPIFFLGIPALIAAIVLLILFLVKATSLKNLIAEG